MPIEFDSELCARLHALPWSTVTDRPVSVLQSSPDLLEADIVGGATWIRGEWRGVVVVRVDRRLAVEIDARLGRPGFTGDGGIDWVLFHAGRSVIDLLGARSIASDSVTLAGPEVWWYPPSCAVRMRAGLALGDAVVVVEIFERQRRQSSPP